MAAITTCLTFDDRCEEAIGLYVSLFENSRITSLVRSAGDGPIPQGKVAQATFELCGRPFTAFDGGPYFSFAQGMSLMVTCETQEEIDRLYEGLAKGGTRQPCGWLIDPFGVSWQIIPAKLGEWLTNAERGNPAKATAAMLGMQKLDIAALERAYHER